MKETTRWFWLGVLDMLFLASVSALSVKILSLIVRYAATN